MRVTSYAARLITALAAISFSAIGAPPNFYQDILPILQTSCQGCHRPGEIGPMPLVTYKQVRPYAAAIREYTQRKIMPPWFADPAIGRFSNDPSLTPHQLQTISDWVKAGAPPGTPQAEPPAVRQTPGWNIAQPDLILRFPKPVPIPPRGEIEYQYIILPTGLTTDRWVQMSEIRPGNRAVVHHAVAYIRPPGSTWLRGAPIGTPFTAETLPNPKDRAGANFTVSDILLVYAPGSLPDQWPSSLAKFLPAGSDIVLQMHYTTNGKAASDRTALGIVLARRPPSKRVLTIQLTNDRFLIPPGDPDHRVEVHGTLPNDALLLTFFPHMHLRGKSFEYNILQPGGKIQTLLRVPKYDFFWQLTYRLSDPVPLKAGTVLQAVATYDNSKNNPHNPDPSSAVSWGEQTSSEMMVGFFDVAVDPALDKQQFFVRPDRQLTGKELFHFKRPPDNLP